MGCRQSQNSPALELVEVHELSLHVHLPLSLHSTMKVYFWRCISSTHELRESWFTSALHPVFALPSSTPILNLPILQKPQIPICLNPQLKNPKNVRAALPSPPRCSAMIWEFHWFAAEPAMIPAHPPPLPGLSAGCIPTCWAAPWSHWTSWGYLRTAQQGFMPLPWLGVRTTQFSQL